MTLMTYFHTHRLLCLSNLTRKAFLATDDSGNRDLQLINVQRIKDYGFIIPK